MNIQTTLPKDKVEAVRNGEKKYFWLKKRPTEKSFIVYLYGGVKVLECNCVAKGKVMSGSPFRYMAEIVGVKEAEHPFRFNTQFSEVE